jgi:hypothetical protein
MRTEHAGRRAASRRSARRNFREFITYDPCV